MDSSLPAPLPPAPDLLAPVYAFRDWHALPEGLASPRTGVTWTSPMLTAECRPRTAEDLVRPSHRAPGRDCNCGIHGYFHPNHDTSKVDFQGVTGVITAWGQVEVHEDGIRAEFARVEALGVYSRWTRRQKAAVSSIAGDLGVDLVDMRDLQDAAAYYATPVPAALVPRAEKVRRAGRARIVRPAPSRVLIFGH
jgi:hypothetical protein